MRGFIIIVLVFFLFWVFCFYIPSNVISLEDVSYNVRTSITSIDIGASLSHLTDKLEDMRGNEEVTYISDSLNIELQVDSII